MQKKTRENKQKQETTRIIIDVVRRSDDGQRRCDAGVIATITIIHDIIVVACAEKPDRNHKKRYILVLSPSHPV